jgi:galactose mutarotase-like enzyme
VSDQHHSWVSVRSAQLSAEINPLGAQLSALRDRAGRDLLWNGDPAVWSGRAPLLFPIVGALVDGRYRLGAKSYQLPRHGFARGAPFEVTQEAVSRANFRLMADDASLQVYPFRFELNVSFALDGATLMITTRIRNLGETHMPASFGYHPAFRWPLPFGQARDAHFIEFEGDEPAPIRRLNANGLLTTQRHPTPVRHRRLALADSLFQQDAVIFDDIRHRSVIYGAPTGPRIRVTFRDAPYLGVWSKPGADFVAIEPWHGIADPDGFSGDFSDKPGVFSVAAGADVSIVMELTIEDG